MRRDWKTKSVSRYQQGRRCVNAALNHPGGVEEVMRRAEEPMTMLETSRPRPRQSRSKATVERIRATAQRLLAEQGAEAVTTVAVAKAAGVSVGGLYRFFADKQAILDAVAVDHLQAFRTRLEADLASLGAGDPAGFLNGVIDSFVGYLADHPDFRALAHGPGLISAETRSAQTGSDEGAILMSFILSALGITPSPALDLKLRVACEAGDRLIAYAFQQPDPATRDAVIAELKMMLQGYLLRAERWEAMLRDRPPTARGRDRRPHHRIRSP